MKNAFNNQTVTYQTPEEVDYGHYASGYYQVEMLNQREVGFTLKADF